MKKDTKKALSIVLATVGVCLALSWAATVGIIYLICLCFSWKFSIAIATGIWLIEGLLFGLFGKKEGK